MAAAAVSLACPLRRSTRLAHAHHSHPHPPNRRTLKYQNHSQNPEPDNEPDSSSSDPENELTPRALRALKRQRLALDPDGLPLSPRPRAKKRRKDNTSPAQRPSTQPLAPKPIQSSDGLPSTCVSSDSCRNSRSTATARAASPSAIPEPISDPALENRPSSPTFHHEHSPSDASKPELSIPLLPMSPDPSPLSSDTEPLTPLTPLTPSPEPSPSLPGHDRQTLPPSPPQDPIPPLDPLPITEPVPGQQHSSTDSFPPPPIPPSLDPALDTLIPFDGLHTQFDPELSVQIPHSPTPPQLQDLELQPPFHSFPQHQLYVPPNPVFVRDREINIWKLACQERVDCLLRRYGVDYIKALVESQARSVSRETGSPPLGATTTTKFRLYTPASYTYSLSSWGSPSGTRKTFSVDDQGDDADPGWPMDDADWVDADIDMEDEDEDDYEDDDDPGTAEAEREGEATLEAVEGLVITDTGVARADSQPTAAMDVDGTNPDTPKATASSEALVPPRSVPDPSLRPSTPIPHPLPPPPLLTPPTLPPLSSLHVPLLSEPPRAFMGRGTPPDRRRLVEWSGSARFSTSGMGPPLYLSPVPQRHANTDVGIIPMSVDQPVHPASPQTQTQHPHTHGEWTSFLYSMLEGDGVGVGVGTGVGHASEPTWYELGLASVPPVVPTSVLDLSPHARTPTPGPMMEQPGDEGSNSSSTLRFALG